MNMIAHQLQLILLDENDALPSGDYTSRYLAYCRVHGRHPLDQLAHDVMRWPGGKMCGFISWMHHQWEAWREAANRKDGCRRHYLDVKSMDDHAELDAQLAVLGPCPGCTACEDSPSQEAPAMLV